ncbi:unnamed protein product [Pleuronectes platessa]|uniref:Uncharacterized protein n=1 Tax=Pleuronectes platessa TaxID=8262 RepID=A0A9N7VBZ5_PLEPL|nr:unnamed protein product [Pleuronectes platessa]
MSSLVCKGKTVRSACLAAGECQMRNPRGNIHRHEAETLPFFNRKLRGARENGRLAWLAVDGITGWFSPCTPSRVGDGLSPRKREVTGLQSASASRARVGELRAHIDDGVRCTHRPCRMILQCSSAAFAPLTAAPVPVLWLSDAGWLRLAAPPSTSTSARPRPLSSRKLVQPEPKWWPPLSFRQHRPEPRCRPAGRQI